MLGQWEKAADRIPDIFGLDAALWEKNIFLFAEKGHLKVSYFRIEHACTYVRKLPLKFLQKISFCHL
jgi:hypothetical protein